MMTISKKLIYRVATICAVLLLGVLMFIVGRGHTVYFDNKTYEAENGKVYESLYRIDLLVNKAEKGQIFSRERVSDTFMGQRAKFTLKVTDVRGGQARELDFSLRIPYSWDGMILNLPALLSGADESVYMSRFIPAVAETVSPEDEVVITDEFTMDPSL